MYTLLLPTGTRSTWLQRKATSLSDDHHCHAVACSAVRHAGEVSHLFASPAPIQGRLMATVQIVKDLAGGYSLWVEGHRQMSGLSLQEAETFESKHAHLNTLREFIISKREQLEAARAARSKAGK